MAERSSKRPPRKGAALESPMAPDVTFESEARPPNTYELLTPAEIKRIHKEPLANYTTVLTPETAAEVLSILRSPKFRVKATGKQWAFRGQGDSKWGLQSSIERISSGSKFRTDEILEQESLLRPFKRRAHHYISNLPDKEDTLEWLALMQHHGAPTRLVACTTSPYVATFFAVSSAQSSEASAVWAFHLPALRGQAFRTLAAEDGKPFRNFSEPQNFTNILFSAPPERRCHPLVVPVEPFRMNERLTVQQGLLLCPRTLRWGFETNLKVALSDAAKRPNLKCPRLYKIVIPESARLGLLEELEKMNITFATLFPGLDGFARSLSTSLQLLFYQWRTLRTPVDMT